MLYIYVFSFHYTALSYVWWVVYVVFFSFREGYEYRVLLDISGHVVC